MAQRIIVVDDDTSILDLLRVLLESEGYVVDTFNAAPQALKSAVKHPPDAAIVDLMMPEMNGLDLLKALRFNSKTRNVPVLICSAYYENMLRSDKELKDLNVRRLRKPFHVEELLDIIEEMTGARPRKRAEGKHTGGGPGKVSAFAAFRP